jgi:hypothetical protein
MINETLRFLTDELNKYIVLKMGPSNEPRLVLGNVARAVDNDPLLNLNKGIISLVNVEEDKVAKMQENYVKKVDGVVYRNPPLYLNLFVLVAGNLPAYNDNLRLISFVLQFFQHQNLFTPITHPGLDSRIEKLMVDINNQSFEQVNHLWSTLGGKYLPSVLYKIRQLTLDEEATVSESGFIKEISINEKLQIPVT